MELTKLAKASSLSFAFDIPGGLVAQRLIEASRRRQSHLGLSRVIEILPKLHRHL
jgi:hypothetical protein